MLAAGLLNYADDYGFFNPHPALIKAAVFPLRETFVPVAKMIEQLVSIGYVRLGTLPDGKKVGEVCNFLSHQRVSHPTESRYSKVEVAWESSRNIPEDSVNTPETFRPEGKGKEGNREQGREASTATAVPAKLVCTLPLIDGTDHNVTEADLQQWQALYLAVDVRQELRNLKGWLLGNPKLRKTKTGMGRFINSWLSRAQNEARPGGSNGKRNQSKTGGNVDAARQALAILAEAERVANDANEVQPEAGGSGELGDLSHLRSGSIEL